MRSRLRAACVALVLTSAVLCPQRPNVVVILVDDMGFSDLGCFGGEIPTPYVDALAEGGLRFRQAYDTGRCCPTRASLLTGLYSHQAGVGHMTADLGVPQYQGYLNDRCVTLGDVARSAGYFTIATGKWHVGGQGPARWPCSRGFDRFYGCPEGGGFYKQVKKGRSIVRNEEVVYDVDHPAPDGYYVTDAFTDEGWAFVDEALEAERPFLWYLAHIAPHFPLQADAETIELYRGRFRAGWDELAAARHARLRELGLLQEGWVPAPRAGGVPAWDELSAAEQDRYDHMMACYAACMHHMDAAVGRVVEGLKQRGVYDDTLILFLSDNGASAESGVKGRSDGDPTEAGSNWWVGRSWAWLSNAPFRLFKHFNHEGGIATPLIAHWPNGLPAERRGSWCDVPVHVIDVMPTLVELAAATHPGRGEDSSVLPMEGRSFVPALRGDGLDGFDERPLFWEHEGNAAVRRGRFKLVRRGGRGDWELHDLLTDRTEQRDLASARPELVAELRQLWLDWAGRCGVRRVGLPKRR